MTLVTARPLRASERSWSGAYVTESWRPWHQERTTIESETGGH